MSKFTNTQYTNTVDNLTEAKKNALVNPYYIHTNSQPTKVNYYRQNVSGTTLDEFADINYAYVNEQSPIKYDLIKEFLLYGIDQIVINMDLGDAGLEADPIEGDCIILPNSIKPLQGDFFTILHTNETLLFKVNAVTEDTLDTRANLYKIQYKLELTNSIDNINLQVLHTYRFLVNNIGTDYKPIVLDSDYDLIRNLELRMEELLKYYGELFFDKKVQTFVFKHDSYRFYDPFMIEFMIRNKIFDFAEDFTYVTHQVLPMKTFGINYAKTLFYSIENKDKNKLSSLITATGTAITDVNSLFYPRANTYFSVDFCDPNDLYKTKLQIFPTDIVNNITNKTYYIDAINNIYNPIIAYMNADNNYITTNIMDIIKNIEYSNEINCFYGIPITIYVISKYIKNSLS